MLLDLLTSHFRKEIDDAWGAFELSNFDAARTRFSRIVDATHGGRITVFDLAESYCGLAAVAFEHKDFFDALRWYKEAYHILDEYHRHTLPRELTWHSTHDRPLMRALMGLGHIAFVRGDRVGAEKWYAKLAERNESDELGISRYIDALESGESFPE